MDRIQNKSFLVAGGGSGIGLSIVQRLLQDGAKIIAIIDLESKSIAVTVNELEREFGKGRVQYLPCDVSNVQQLEETFAKIWNTLNGVDVVINSASVINDCKWEQTISVNVIFACISEMPLRKNALISSNIQSVSNLNGQPTKVLIYRLKEEEEKADNGVIQGSLLALNYMGKHNGGKGGTIINISSMAGFQVFAPWPVYCSSKHAVLAFSRCLQENFEKTGVRVLVLCPGVMTTSFIHDTLEKSLDFINEKHLENLESYPTQSTEYVASAIISLLLKGPNGSVWVSEAQKPPYAVEFPPYKKVELNL